MCVLLAAVPAHCREVFVLSSCTRPERVWWLQPFFHTRAPRECAGISSNGCCWDVTVALLQPAARGCVAGTVRHPCCYAYALASWPSRLPVHAPSVTALGLPDQHQTRLPQAPDKGFHWVDSTGLKAHSHMSPLQRLAAMHSNLLSVSISADFPPSPRHQQTPAKPLQAQRRQFLQC